MTNNPINLKEENNNGAALGGIVLIIIGIAFLFGQSLFGILGERVWLVFLAIPIGGVVAAAYQSYVEAGKQMTRQVWQRLIWGLFPFVFGFWWVTGWSYSLLWPAMVIFIGLNMIIRRND